jgi:hypothetical protein
MRGKVTTTDDIGVAHPLSARSQANLETRLRLEQAFEVLVTSVAQVTDAQLRA